MNFKISVVASCLSSHSIDIYMVSIQNDLKNHSFCWNYSRWQKLLLARFSFSRSMMRRCLIMCLICPFLLDFFFLFGITVKNLFRASFTPPLLPLLSVLWMISLHVSIKNIRCTIFGLQPLTYLSYSLACFGRCLELLETSMPYNLRSVRPTHAFCAQSMRNTLIGVKVPPD